MARRRVHIDLEPGASFETCLDDEPSPESLAALDDLARAAVSMMRDSRKMSIMSTTVIYDQWRVWCHDCDHVEWCRTRASVVRAQQTHECPSQ